MTDNSKFNRLVIGFLKIEITGSRTVIFGIEVHGLAPITNLNGCA